MYETLYYTIYYTMLFSIILHDYIIPGSMYDQNTFNIMLLYCTITLNNIILCNTILC